ncbi:hypothetical protein NHX12_003220 [Muraenolepis orangiensis]|uniref:Uncharacterized protein n=1 Tax=Muraenolepis orangiensis TaxID=630683 RepID=A0A9Q0DXM2_9TELE|nr:hypothetical protein NHX12_003220 [Muraenolepis orangiensis]
MLDFIDEDQVQIRELLSVRYLSEILEPHRLKLLSEDSPAASGPCPSEAMNNDQSDEREREMVYRVKVNLSTVFDGLLVTGLYTSTPVQSAPIPAPAAFGFRAGPDAVSYRDGAEEQRDTDGEEKKDK